LPWVFIRKPGTPVNFQAPYLSGLRGALHFVVMILFGALPVRELLKIARGLLLL
jgi:hypothetical protein